VFVPRLWFFIQIAIEIGIEIDPFPLLVVIRRLGAQGFVSFLGPRCRI